MSHAGFETLMRLAASSQVGGAPGCPSCHQGGMWVKHGKVVDSMMLHWACSQTANCGLEAILGLTQSAFRIGRPMRATAGDIWGQAKV